MLTTPTRIITLSSVVDFGNSFRPAALVFEPNILAACKWLRRPFAAHGNARRLATLCSIDAIGKVKQCGRPVQVPIRHTLRCRDFGSGAYIATLGVSRLPPSPCHVRSSASVALASTRVLPSSATASATLPLLPRRYYQRECATSDLISILSVSPSFGPLLEQRIRVGGMYHDASDGTHQPLHSVYRIVATSRIF